MRLRLIYGAGFAVVMIAMTIELVARHAEDPEIGWSGWVALAVGVAVIVIAWRNRDPVGTDTFARLGWSPAPYGLYRRIPAFPFDRVQSGTVFGAGGPWRGRRAESVRVVHASAGSSTDLGYRVDILETAVALPPLLIIPNTLAEHLETGWGDVVDVESAAFNDRYRILAADPRYAHAVLSPTVIEALLALPPGFPVGFGGGAIYTWRAATYAIEHGTPARLEALAAVDAEVPEFVAKEFGAAAAHIPAPGPEAMGAPRDLRALSWAALAAALLGCTLPVGIVLGHLCLRAGQRGDAIHLNAAWIALAYSYTALALLLAVWSSRIIAAVAG